MKHHSQMPWTPTINITAIHMGSVLVFLFSLFLPRKQNIYFRILKQFKTRHALMPHAELFETAATCEVRLIYFGTLENSYGFISGAKNCIISHSCKGSSTSFI